MPTSSGARSLVNMRVTRIADVAGPISTQERIGTTPQLPSLVTNTEMVPDVQITRIPVPPLEYGPRSSSLPRPLSLGVLETPGGESAQASYPPPRATSPPAPFQDDSESRLVALVNEMSAEMLVLRSEVAALKTAEMQSRELIEDLKSSVKDLEEIVLRELIEDTPKPEVKGKMSRKKMSAKAANTRKGDVLSRQSRHKRKSSSDGASSEEEEPSSSEEEAPQPEPRGAKVPGLTEQVTRRPEFKSLVSYRTYRLRNTDQKVDSSVTGRVNANLKRLKHCLDFKFSGEPAIQVVDFLRTFKEAADLNAIGEGEAAILLSYFLEGRAKSGLSSRMKHIAASMPKYPAAVQWLLQSFATEAVIAASYQKVFTARQLSEENETAFANRINRYAAEAGSVFSEDALISAYVDGLHSYASNMVRGQVTTIMTFAKVQILAEQVGAAGRALTSASRASTRVVFPGQGTPVGRNRPKYELAASAETGSPSWGLPENGRTSHVSPILVAPAEFSPFDGTQEQPSQEDSQSVTSSLSCPTRGWVSAAGSVMDDAVMAIDGRSRGCHLCFNTGHFLMECPLLGSDVRQAAHQQRDLKYPKGPSWKTSFSPLRDARAPLLTRNQTSNRFDDSRRSAVAVHPVVEYPDPRGEMRPPSIKEAENESREA